MSVFLFLLRFVENWGRGPFFHLVGCEGLVDLVPLLSLWVVPRIILGAVKVP